MSLLKSLRCKLNKKTNSSGQVAIFLVLLFQVLFVFFAMSMNVGLVVYDKINLQNSVDISAYYAAQKQAELLNQIAHINYQMRQAYKLLTFRIRVIGSASIGFGPRARLNKHPLLMAPAFPQEAQSFFERPPGRHVPGVCIGSNLWEEYRITEPGANASLCANLASLTSVSSSGSSDPFGFTTGLNAFLDRVRAEQEEKCKVVGVINWQLAASWFLAYIHEVTRRKEMIDAIANNMSLSGSEVKDFTGESIFTGAQSTFSKNLTEPQRQAIVEYKLINSLSDDVGGSCSDKNFWLPTIDIFPVVSYVSMLWLTSDCVTGVKMNRGNNAPPADYLALVGGRNNPLLKSVWDSGQPVPYGVEKNPWCMPYMGVRATTQPRKIFSPFGTPTILKAEAYAKPFGGRIGPWYSNQWSSGDTNSSGTIKIDPLIPARSVASSRVGGAPEDDLVNHSKYPGDRYGMNSEYALGVMSNFYRTAMVGGDPLAPNAPSVFALAHYKHIGDPPLFESEPDSLARSNGLTAPDGSKVRLLEEAAIVPDLFDTTYYSVEAQYSFNYHNPNLEHFRSFVEPYYPDLGSQNRNPYSVVNQMARSRQVYPPGNYPFYVLEQPDHLLTGWTQKSAVNYDFPDNHFGKCLTRKDADMEQKPGPGGCPHGGRSGYSVKVVSKSYLLDVSADLGGPGNSGSILNPPPE